MNIMDDKESEKIKQRTLGLIDAIRKNNVLNPHNISLETKYLLVNADEEVKTLLLREVYLSNLKTLFYHKSPLSEDVLIMDLKLKDGSNLRTAAIDSSTKLSNKVCSDIVSVLIENNNDENQKNRYLEEVPWIDLNQYRKILEMHFPMQYGAVLNNLSCFAQAEGILKGNQGNVKLETNDFIEEILEKAFRKDDKTGLYGIGCLIRQMEQEADKDQNRCDDERSVTLAIKTKIKRCQSIEELTECIAIYRDFLNGYERKNLKNKHKAIYYVFNANKNLGKTKNSPLGLSYLEISGVLEKVLGEAINEKDIRDSLVTMSVSPEGMFRRNVREVEYRINSLAYANLNFMSERGIRFNNESELSILQKEVREIIKAGLEKTLQEDINNDEKSGIHTMPIYLLRDYNDLYIENWEKSILSICSRIMGDVKESCEQIEKMKVSQEGEYTVIKVSHISEPGVFDEMKIKKILETIALGRISALSDRSVAGYKKEVDDREILELNKKADIYMDEYLSHQEVARYRNSKNEESGASKEMVDDTRVLKKSAVKKF